MTDKIKILEEFKPEKQIFNKEEFLKYLSLHRDDLKDTSTTKLDKMFSINGYRITKIKGEIAVRTDNFIPKENRTFKSNDLKILDDKINFIIDVLKEKGLIEDEEN
jgi:hypothetical protein